MSGARILAVFPDHPWPTDMGSRVRNLRILEALAPEFELTMVSLVHDPARLEDPGPLARLGRWVPLLAPHRRGFLPWAYWHVRARWSGLTEGLHRETFFQSLPVLAEAVDRLLRTESFDLVHAAYWYGLRGLRRRPRPPLWVVDTHDVQFERHARVLGRASGRERKRELAELSRYDCIVAITERDRQTFRAHLPNGGPPVEVIAMGPDLERWRPGGDEARPPAPRIAFYGNLATRANQDGVRHLLRDLLPAVRKHCPDAGVLLIGPGLPESLRREAERDGAEVTGFVADPRPWLASARVLALSLQAGSGQRGRVLEALALGVPVAGYAEALAGLELKDGEGVIQTESAGGLERALLDLLRRPEEARRLGMLGRRCVEERYDQSATYGRFPALYRRLLEEGSPRPRT